MLALYTKKKAHVSESYRKISILGSSQTVKLRALLDAAALSLLALSSHVCRILSLTKESFNKVPINPTSRINEDASSCQMG